MKSSATFFALNLLSLFHSYAQHSATLSGHLLHFKSDSVRIVLLLNDITSESKLYSTVAKNGQFSQEISIVKPTQVFFSDGTNYLNGLVEPGDNIYIKYDCDNFGGSLELSGKGSEKYSFKVSLHKYNFSKKVSGEVSYAKSTRYPFDHLLKFADRVGTAFMDSLNSIKPLISTESFELLKDQVNIELWRIKYRSATMVHHESIEETLKNRQNELTPYSRQFLSHVLDFDETTFNSTLVANDVYSILFMHYDGLVLAGKANKNLIEKYNYLSKKLPQKIKTPVLTLFLESDIKKLNQAEDLKTLINQIYSDKADSVYKKYIEKRYHDAATFEKGMAAPDFILENEKGEKVTLSSFKGKVVYVDFWFGACGPCHALFNTIKPVKKYFSKQNNVVFLNISIDDKRTWEAALKKYDIPGYHVFTENKGKEHPITGSYKVAGYPTTCLIDRNGNFFSLNPPVNSNELTRLIESALD